MSLKHIILLLAVMCVTLADVYAYNIIASGKDIVYDNGSVNDPKLDMRDYNVPQTSRKLGEGLKHIVLDKHFYEGKYDTNQPILTQEDFKYANTLYEIRSDYLLIEDICLPANCILDFEGGSLRGKTIIGNNASIVASDYSIFNDCVVKNFNLPYVDPRWVGAVPDYNEQTQKGTDNSVFFQRAYDNIVENHPGIDMLIIGKYLISKPVLMKMQCHIKGIHNNTRGLVKRGLHKETGGSSSLIAVGECSAFKVIGIESEERTWADLSVEHIKFVGLNKNKSIAIQYEASGSPTRPATIEKCEASNLLYFLFSKAKENTTLGNLTVRENNIYNCTKAIYAVSDPAHYMGITALKIENNVIEHNGDKCIHLNRCFGPIIIDNNILEGQSNPIYLTSTFPTETNYVISNNYFEQPGNNDKKIHIDGVIRNDRRDTEDALFQTYVEIYGNTSPYGFSIELNGVVVRRLDRIDTPAKWEHNYSTFTRCLFENIDLSDVYISQFKDWNFSTNYPTSLILRNNALIGDAGADLLSFDDCRGNRHDNKLAKPTVSIKGDTGKGCNLIITKIRPRITDKYKRVIVKYTYNKEEKSFAAMFPREIPYYVFTAFRRNMSSPNSNYNLIFSGYNEGTDIEISNTTVYQNVNGALFNYPHILLPYTHN